LSFYEHSIRTKLGIVWNNLEIFGVRGDLEILDSGEVEYPKRDTLARTKLYDDGKFMALMFRMLA
jgi:hypothetical protein